MFEIDPMQKDGQILKIYFPELEETGQILTQCCQVLIIQINLDIGIQFVNHFGLIDLKFKG